jgi:hypothetical protein
MCYRVGDATGTLDRKAEIRRDGAGFVAAAYSDSANRNLSRESRA